MLNPTLAYAFYAISFLFSLILTLLWRRTRTLWAPVGVHAAGVAVLRTYGAFTDRTPPRTWAGSKELFDGPPVWALLLLALGVLAAWRKTAPLDAAPGSSPEEPASGGG